MSGIFGIWRRDGAPVDPDEARNALTTLDGGRTQDRGYLLCGTKTGKTIICRDEGTEGLDSHRGEQFDLILGSSQPETTDLGRSGRQPATDETGRIFCVYDGEIYNRNEIRDSGRKYMEAEAPLVTACFARTGIASLSRLNGLFSLAFWDKQSRELTLARDPVGGRPLFYRDRENTFIFSSRIKGILAAGWVTPKANLPAIRDFIVEDYPAITDTWFAGIQRLAAGTCLSVIRKSVDARRYWMADYNSGKIRPEREYTENLRAEISRAVKVRHGDPTGICAHISGGVDSSTVVSFLARQAGGELINTYSGHYAGYIGDPCFDETPDADLVALAAGCPNKKVVVDFQKLPEKLPRIVHLLEEPHGVGAFSQYCVFEASRDGGEKVVFCGEGGDELFAGYDHHKSKASLDMLIPIPHLNSLRQLKTEQLKTLLLQLYPFRQRRLRRREERKDLPFKQSYISASDQILTPIIPHPTPRGFLNKSMVFEFGVELPCLMQLEQGLASAFNLRIRSPLTDLRIVRLAQSIPSSLLVHGTTTKYCLRQAARHLVPPEVIWRKKKMGFSSPFARVIRRGGVRDYLLELLSAASAPPFLSSGYILDIISEHTSETADHSFLIWKLLYLAEWFRVFKPGL